jgi:hypothetical protein
MLSNRYNFHSDYLMPENFHDRIARQIDIEIKRIGYVSGTHLLCNFIVKSK